MKIERIEYNSELWKKTIDFAENCSWIAGEHIAGMLRENRFSEWEAFLQRLKMIMLLVTVLS